MIRKLLLICGILTPLFYAFADALSGTLWTDYSFRDQTISELGAIGAPSRPLFAALLVPTYLLLGAFGIGVWQSAGTRPRLRSVGGLLVGLAILALGVGQFVPMRERGVEQGMAGALHLIEGGVAMLMLFVAMGIAATALGRRFGLYTLATIAVVLIFGAWSSMDAPQLEAGLETAWLGVKERIFWYAYQLWFLVLALVLLRKTVAKTLLQE